MSTGKKKGLGRGLSALFGDQAKPEKNIEKKAVNTVSISDLSRNPYQPRQLFNETKLEELSQSIKKINPWISDDNLRIILREFVQITNLNLMEANQKVYEKITKYLSVEQDLGEERKSHTVKIIDFENLENNSD